MKSNDFNGDLGHKMKAARAVLKPRGSTFRLVVIVVISAAVVMGIYAWR